MVKLKSNKNVADFQAALKKIAADAKTETAIAELQTTIKNVNPDRGEGERAAAQRQDLQDHQKLPQAVLVEKLVTGKLQKPPYLRAGSPTEEES